MLQVIALDAVFILLLLLFSELLMKKSYELLVVMFDICCGNVFCLGGCCSYNWTCCCNCEYV